MNAKYEIGDILISNGKEKKLILKITHVNLVLNDSPLYRLKALNNYTIDSEIYLFEWELELMEVTKTEMSKVLYE